MSELKFKYLNEIDISSSLTDSAHVIVEDSGSIKRAPMNQLVTDSGVSSWNDLTDRPFYEENNQTVIEWDGNTEGRDVWASDTSGYCKVSDETPQQENCIGGSIAMSTGNTLDGITSAQMLTGTNCYGIGNNVLIAFDTEINFMGTDITLPSTGIYFLYALSDGVVANYISSFSYGSTTVHPLDEKFIPDSIARVSDITTAVSWNDLKDKPFGENAEIILPETTIDFEENYQGYGVFGAKFPIYLNLNGIMYDVVFDGELYSSIDSGGNAHIIDPDAEDNGLPFCFEIDRYRQNIYTNRSGDSHTIEVSQYVVTATLDEKYIPNTIARVEDQNILEDRITANEYDINVQEGRVSALETDVGTTVNQVSANETAIGDLNTAIAGLAPVAKTGSWDELADKPFGEIQTVIEWDGNTEGRDIFAPSSTMQYCKVSDLIPAETDFVGGRLLMNDGTAIDIAEEAVSVLESGGFCVIDGNSFPIIFALSDTNVTAMGNATAPSTGIYFHINNTYPSSLTYGSTKTIEEKFIPDSIKAQPDWSQNDETATDYVKNRTHWKEEATEILFSETNIDFSDTVSRPASFQLDEGAYIVTIDGETYYYELLTYNGTNYIGDIQGNPIVVSVQEGDLLIGMANGGVHSIEIYRDKTIYHKLDSRYIDAAQEFIIPIDFNNATLTGSTTNGYFAGSKQYKVAIETPYYEIVKEYSAGKHLIVRLDNMRNQSYFFTLISTDGTSFSFESTVIIGPNTRITNMSIQLGQTSISSNTAKVYLQIASIETNMPPEPASAIADLTAAPTMEDFNNLLAVLRNAGYLAT